MRHDKYLNASRQALKPFDFTCIIEISRKSPEVSRNFPPERKNKLFLQAPEYQDHRVRFHLRKKRFNPFAVRCEGEIIRGLPSSPSRSNGNFFVARTAIFLPSPPHAESARRALLSGVFPSPHFQFPGINPPRNFHKAAPICLSTDHCTQQVSRICLSRDKTDFIISTGNDKFPRTLK